MQSKSTRTRARAVAIIFVGVLFLTSAWAADHLTVLYSFGGDPSGDGGGASLIRDAAGNFYGTGDGGIYLCGEFHLPCGTVYELSPVEGGGWTKTVLYNFGNGTDESGPKGLIMDPAGNLYGVTASGGLYDGGVAFELSPTEGGGWTETVLYSFSSGSEFGYSSYNLWRDAAGNLYGTTTEGGTYSAGMVFELSPGGGGEWTETVLWSFGGGSDGKFPESGVIMDHNGNIYGTTLQGGTYCSGCGIVYELSPGENGNWTETVLHNFDGDDGSEPLDNPILDAAGNLYGTTSEGGAYSDGTAFELSPSVGGSWTETVLHSFQFDGHDGYLSVAPLTLDPAGNLFGTTYAGGTNGEGIVFELSPRQGSWRETVLYNLGSGNEGGVISGDVVMDRAGDLYGNTEGGGLYGYGTAFELTPPAVRLGVSAVH